MQNEKLCSESEQSLAAVRNRQPDAHACNGYAAVYIRVSTDEQARGGISLDAQDELANAYCKTASLRTRRVIREEGISASKPLSERPGGKELLSLIAWNKVQHVVALKLDRLFRDAEDALRVTKAWDKAGVALHLVDMGGQSLNTATAVGRFFLNMMAGFAELERDLIAERNLAALAFKKARGQVYSPTPYGFKRVDDRLIKHPFEMKIVRAMKKLRREGWTLGRIADQLTKSDISTKAGGRRWYASTVRYVLNNDLYSKAA
jgi:DNA invertase Pin-like site-specific DNA recombinase